MEQLSKLSDQQLADARAYILSHKKSNTMSPIVLSGLAATSTGIYSRLLWKDGRRKSAVAMGALSAVIGANTCVWIKKEASRREMWEDLQRRFELEIESRQRAKL